MGEVLIFLFIVFFIWCFYKDIQYGKNMSPEKRRKRAQIDNYYRNRKIAKKERKRDRKRTIVDTIILFDIFKK